MINIDADHAQMGTDLISLHLDHLEAAGRSEHTREARRNVLTRVHDYLPFGLAYAATEQLEAWLKTVHGIHDRRPASRWTKVTYVYHLRAFYRWACAAGFLEGDPTMLMGRHRNPKLVPKPVTEDDLARALEAPEPWRTGFILAAFEGMRVSEIAACDRDHVTAEMILIPDGKGGDPGTVPTHPYVWDHIRNRPSGLLLLNRRGFPLTGHQISLAARYHLDKLGLPQVHMHMLRHRYGTMIQEMHGDLRVTQECLRHLSVASTQGYTLVTKGRRAAAVAALPVPGVARAED